MLRDQIPKVLQARISLEHACRQIPHQTQQRQQNPVDGPQHHPIRPFLYPSAKGGQSHAEGASANDSLHRLVGTGLPCGGADGAELCLAKASAGKVSSHVAEGDAEPRPEDEVGTGRDGELDGFG